MRGVSGPVFKLDVPSLLPISIPLSTTDILVVITVSLFVVKLLQFFLGVVGLIFGVITGPVVGVGLVLLTRRLFPGPQLAYFLEWTTVQKDFYENRPTAPPPPLVIYGESEA